MRALCYAMLRPIFTHLRHEGQGQDQLGEDEEEAQLLPGAQHAGARAQTPLQQLLNHTHKHTYTLCELLIRVDATPGRVRDMMVCNPTRTADTHTFQSGGLGALGLSRGALFPVTCSHRSLSNGHQNRHACMHADAVHVRTTCPHGRHTPVAYLALEAEFI